MTEPTELYITKADIPEMYSTVDNTLSVPFLASLEAVTGDMDLSTKMQLRMSYLGLVDAIEKDLGIRPTTAECRKIVKGKL